MNEGQGGSVLGGTNAFSDDIVVFSNDKQEKSGKKWLTGAVVVAGVIGVVLIGLILFRVFSASNAEEVRGAYWSYMNYLVRGDSSTDILSESDFTYAGTAARKAFDVTDNAYFKELDNKFGVFYRLFDGHSGIFGNATKSAVAELKKTVDFVVLLRQSVSSLDENELIKSFVSGQDLVQLERQKFSTMVDTSESVREYVDERIGFVEKYNEMLELVSGEGCLSDGVVETECVYNKSIRSSYISLAKALSSIKRKISADEMDALNKMLYDSWNVANLIQENGNEI